MQGDDWLNGGGDWEQDDRSAATGKGPYNKTTQAYT
jgi:hypothetical protein